jgi:oligopeptide transport system permease protein
MTVNNSAKNPKIASLTEQHTQSKSLMRDSLERLSRNRMAMIGIVVIILNFLVAIFADRLAPHRYDTTSLTQANAAPQWVMDMFPTMRPVGEANGYVKLVDASIYPLGTDGIGRDLLSRLIYGSRVSLAVAVVGPTVAILIGVLYGLFSGYLGGWVDSLLMRFVDVVYAFPSLLLIIMMMAYFRSGVFSKPEFQGTLAGYLYQLDSSMGGMLFIFIGIGFTSWIGLARLTRGQVLSIREQDYILAARALGAKSHTIIFNHILPNILGPLIVSETLSIPGYILAEAFLSFIGLGVNPPTPSWGEMISTGATTLSSYPYQAIFPALALFIVMFAFNFLGDGLRDAFDPRMRGKD